MRNPSQKDPLRLIVWMCAGALVFSACGKSETETAAVSGQPPVQAVAPAPSSFSNWVEYVSVPFGFSVLTPKSFDLYKDKSSTSAGEIEYLTYLAEMGPVSFGIVCNDFDPNFLAGVDSKILLTDGIKGFVEKLGGTTTGERPVSLAGSEGREITLTGAAQGVALYGKARFFLVGNRLYQLAVIAEKGQENTAAIEHFFESFKLKAKQ